MIRGTKEGEEPSSLHLSLVSQRNRAPRSPSALAAPPPRELHCCIAKHPQPREGLCNGLRRLLVLKKLHKVNIHQHCFYLLENTCVRRAHQLHSFPYNCLKHDFFDQGCGICYQLLNGHVCHGPCLNIPSWKKHAILQHDGVMLGFHRVVPTHT